MPAEEIKSRPHTRPSESSLVSGTLVSPQDRLETRLSKSRAECSRMSYVLTFSGLQSDQTPPIGRYPTGRHPGLASAAYSYDFLRSSNGLMRQTKIDLTPR